MLKALAVAGGISLLALNAMAQPAADPDLLTQDPDRAASLMAAGAFMFGCLETARFATSGEAYAASADTLAAGIKAKLPEGHDYPFALESVDGNTCRVTYHGVNADGLWRALSLLFDPSKQIGCDITPATPTRMTAACAATVRSPAYVLGGKRDGDRVSMSLIWRGPKTP